MIDLIQRHRVAGSGALSFTHGGVSVDVVDPGDIADHWPCAHLD